VHFDVPVGGEEPRPGDIVTVTIAEAAPYHLLADGSANYTVRRTIGGDAYELEQARADAGETSELGSKASAGKRSLTLSVKK
jgi:tRNA-2-methylthio-N6-dimethylallyladenosine synthase